MASSRLLTKNRSQVVRLPEAFAFSADVHQVDIVKIGRARLIMPHGRRWDDLFESGPRTSDDFLPIRIQPDNDRREAF